MRVLISSPFQRRLFSSLTLLKPSSERYPVALRWYCDYYQRTHNDVIIEKILKRLTTTDIDIEAVTVLTDQSERDDLGKRDGVREFTQLAQENGRDTGYGLRLLLVLPIKTGLRQATSQLRKSRQLLWRHGSTSIGCRMFLANTTSWDKKWLLYSREVKYLNDSRKKAAWQETYPGAGSSDFFNTPFIYRVKAFLSHQYWSCLRRVGPIPTTIPQYHRAGLTIFEYWRTLAPLKCLDATLGIGATVPEDVFRRQCDV
ncbi:uncharacterized protein CLUP02_00999 [Colletotrichum lupini]|uniref:Uncharacterized protein n=1 Tax=Colletotrichum lupini TaxID=145971 RepID=A0A9Q8SCE8_9PEZI|nr:uncharacterized protein CLUP02_00999 [Colletotrichum lupini]UQC74351.1 hypothetical protein CLUP02_00999 [Colletotrichum lupini]